MEIQKCMDLFICLEFVLLLIIILHECTKSLVVYLCVFSVHCFVIMLQQALLAFTLTDAMPEELP